MGWKGNVPFGKKKRGREGGREGRRKAERREDRHVLVGLWSFIFETEKVPVAMMKGVRFWEHYVAVLVRFYC